MSVLWSIWPIILMIFYIVITWGLLKAEVYDSATVVNEVVEVVLE